MEHIEKTGVHSGDSISVYPPYSLSQKVRNQIVSYTVKLGLAVGIKGLFNIQFIVDSSERVYIIEVNPRSSRSVPFLSKATGIEMANIATKVILGKRLPEMGYHLGLALENPTRCYVKAPAFSFSKISGLDTYLGPEMKSTGEAIGYDDTLNKALYKALEASGMKIRSYGTVFLTIARQDREEALEIAERFYRLGFNLVATEGTAMYLREHGLRVKILSKISEGSSDILEWIEKGFIKYVINTMSFSDEKIMSDGYIIRTTAARYNITTLTSLDTTRVLLTVLEDTAINVSTIDGN
jgi:carbamoyl-phosphate synthase large subunit